MNQPVNYLQIFEDKDDTVPEIVDKKGYMGIAKLSFAIFFVFVLFLILAMLPFFTKSASFTPSVNPPIIVVPEYSQLLNFTINNTDSSENITVVNITLPNGFSFLVNTNGTTAGDVKFSNTTSVLTWENTTTNGFIENGSMQHFWFSVSAPLTPGAYNFTITTLDTNGTISSTNVTVTITKPFSLGTTPWSDCPPDNRCPAINMSNATDIFFYDGNIVEIIANYTNNKGGVPGLDVKANLSEVGGQESVSATYLGNGLYKFVFTINYSAISVNLIEGKNVTISATNGSTWINVTIPVVLVNMTVPPGCPPEQDKLPPQVPLLNGTIVNISGCSTSCTTLDRAEWNGSAWVVCGPTFGGSSTNFNTIAYSGDFSAVPFVLEIPGKVKINFTTPVDMSTQEKFGAIMEFAVRNIMMPGRVGINETEWDGTTKPNLNVSARITFYHVKNYLSISGDPQIFMEDFGGGNRRPCTTCANIIWDGENLTFTVSHFSDYGLTDGINVTLQSPYNMSYVNNHTINFTYIPTWNSTIAMDNCTLWGNFTGAWAANKTNESALINNETNWIVNTVPGDNVYIWNIYCYDVNGLKDFYSINWTVIVDTQAPTLAIILPQNTTYNYKTNLPLNYTASDASLQSCWYNLNNGNNITLPNCQNTTFNVSQDGTHTITIFANDSAGNLNSTSITFSVDTTPPTITINNPTNATINSDFFNFTYSDVACSWYSIDSQQNITNCSIVNNNWAGTLAGLSDGFHNIIVYANDSVGNTNYSIRYWTRDTTPPSIALPFYTNATIKKSTSMLVLNILVSDASQVQACFVSIKGQSSNQTIAYTNGWCNATINLINATEGNSTIYVYANDSAGNYGLNNSYVVWIDDTAPSLAIILPQNTTYNYKTNLPLNYTASDILLQSCWYNLNSQQNITLPNCQNTTFNVSQDGTHTITIFANDSAGNLNSTSITFSVDTTPPTITINNPTNATINSDFFNFTYSDVACSWYSIDSQQNIINCSIVNNNWAGTLAGLSDGFHNITVYANDSVGNTNYSIRYWTRDTTPPSIALPFYTNATIKKSTSMLVLNISVSDATQIQACLVRIEGQASNQTISYASGWCNATISLANSNEGNSTIYIYANDSAGNYGLNNSYVVWIDDTAPSLAIILPQNTTYNYKTNLPLNYTASDILLQSCWYNLNSQQNITLPNCQNTTFNVSQDSTYTITLYANDSAGNLNSTSITFSVDTTPPTITINNPTNATINSDFFNFTYSDVACSWYSIDSQQNIINCSIVNNNWAGTLAGLSDGFHNITVYANDSVGNTNYSIRYWTRDTTPPTITKKFINVSTAYTDTIICINASITEATAISNVWTTITQSNGTILNITLSDTGSCAGTAGDGWYSANINVGNKTGTFYYNTTYANDTLGNLGTNTTVLSIAIQSQDVISPTVTLNSPTDYANLSTTTITFNCTAWDDVNLTNITLYGSWQGWHANETNTSGINNTNYVFTKTLADGTYTWNCYACDNSSNCGFASANYTLTIDTTPPIITIISPQNTTYYVDNVSNYSISLQYVVIEALIDSCWYSIDGGNTNTSLENCTNTTILFTSNGTKTVWVYANDTLGNENRTSVTFTAVPKKADGAACTSNNECSGGYCVHGICRSSSTYCGDGYCDSPIETSSNCPQDCGVVSSGGVISSFIGKTYSWSKLEKNEVVNLTLNVYNIPIDKIEFIVANKSESPRISITPTSKPVHMQAPKGKVFKYIRITHTNLNVAQVKLRFKVTKSWVEENNLSASSIVLEKYTDGKWVALPTSFVMETSSHYYFESTMSGLSYFAIVGKEEEVREEVCASGEKRCFNTILQECINGSWKDIEVCEYGCDITEKKCVEIKEEEVTPEERVEKERKEVCKEGDVKCVGNAAYICINNDWSLSEICDYKCINGRCIEREMKRMVNIYYYYVLFGIVAALIIVTIGIFIIHKKMRYRTSIFV